MHAEFWLHFGKKGRGGVGPLGPSCGSTTASLSHGLSVKISVGGGGGWKETMRLNWHFQVVGRFKPTFVLGEGGGYGYFFKQQNKEFHFLFYIAVVIIFYIPRNFSNQLR